MQSDNEAKILLGFSPNSLPSPSQIKSAYRRKVWETHPDRFPPHLKAEAESNFKLISEAYSFLNSPGNFLPSSFLRGEQIKKPSNSILLSSCRCSNRSWKPEWRRNENWCFSSFCFHHLWCTWSCWINCLQGLWKTEGGSSFFQSFSPLNTLRSYYIFTYSTYPLHCTDSPSLPFKIGE